MQNIFQPKTHPVDDAMESTRKFEFKMGSGGMLSEHGGAVDKFKHVYGGSDNSNPSGYVRH